MIRHGSLYLILIIVSALSIVDSSTSQGLNNDAAFYRPAVIQIGVHYQARFQVPYPEFHFENGEFVFSPQAEFYFEEVVGHWNGTGFIITPNGYILTNAHISDVEHYKKFGYLSDHTRQMADLFINEISYEQYDLFLQSYSNYLIEYGNFTFEEERIQIIFGDESYEAINVISGDPIGLRSSKDVALIKVNSTKEYLFPTVRLGDSDNVEIGDTITTLGFPIMYSDNSDDPYEMRLATGRIVGMKPMGDWEAFQTDADITFGHSGGPVFNSKGEVIGIATFGAISPLTKMTENFLIPINIAHNLLDQVSVKNARSIIDNHYEKGLELLWNGEYNSSIIEFTKVLDLNPYHPYAGYYLNIAHQEAGGTTVQSIETTETYLTEQRLSTVVIVKTTTVTKIVFRTQMKTSLSTIARPEMPSKNDNPMIYVLLTFLIIASCALILIILRRTPTS